MKTVQFNEKSTLMPAAQQLSCVQLTVQRFVLWRLKVYIRKWHLPSHSFIFVTSASAIAANFILWACVANFYGQS